MSATSCKPLNVLFNIMLLALIRRRFLRWGPSYTHYCRVLTLALARLFCKYINIHIYVADTDRYGASYCNHMCRVAQKSKPRSCQPFCFKYLH